ncbi:MAG: hypothetical protein ACRDO0_02395 [Nocardioidaceae bacterium]
MTISRLAAHRRRGAARVPLPRLLGALTLAYGAAVAARPALLTRQAGLETAVWSSPRARRVARAIGMRDVVSGAAMVLAPAGRPLQRAVAVRVACDLGDVVGFGLGLLGARNKAKAVGAAAGWGLLCASSWSAAGRL